MPAAVDRSGSIYGRLIVVRRERSSGRTMYVCDCACGNEIVVRGDSLSSGRTQSCGCFLIESHQTHGLCESKTYHAWEAMKQRCSNEKTRCYSDYGGRGIKVCKRWLESFDNFLTDMGQAPDGLSLDRKNNDGDYELDNCRWASRVEQGRNQRTNRLLTCKGKTQTLSAWCAETGLNRGTVNSRIKRGWNVEKALES